VLPLLTCHNAAPVGSPRGPPNVTVRRGLIGPVCPAGQVSAPACSSLIVDGESGEHGRKLAWADHHLVTGVPRGGAGGCGGVGRIAVSPQTGAHLAGRAGPIRGVGSRRGDLTAITGGVTKTKRDVEATARISPPAAD
jgi:hypothetical protein